MGHAEPDADSNAGPDTQQFAEQGTAAVTGSTAVQRANRAGAADSFRGSTRGLRDACDRCLELDPAYEKAAYKKTYDKTYAGAYAKASAQAYAKACGRLRSPTPRPAGGKRSRDQSHYDFHYDFQA